jgi:hypothetical protein
MSYSSATEQDCKLTQENPQAPQKEKKKNGKQKSATPLSFEKHT